MYTEEWVGICISTLVVTVTIAVYMVNRYIDTFQAKIDHSISIPKHIQNDDTLWTSELPSSCDSDDSDSDE